MMIGSPNRGTKKNPLSLENRWYKISIGNMMIHREVGSTNEIRWCWLYGRKPMEPPNHKTSIYVICIYICVCVYVCMYVWPQSIKKHSLKNVSVSAWFKFFLENHRHQRINASTVPRLWSRGCAVASSRKEPTCNRGTATLCMCVLIIPSIYVYI